MWRVRSGSKDWLNAFDALGAAGAAILLMLWVSACTNGAF
jgi:hypothetical protein